MRAEKIKEIYKYGKDNQALLTSGVVVIAEEVIVKDKKVVNVPRADVTLTHATLGEVKFHFSVYEDYCILNNVPKEVEGEKIKNEFITYVETDIK